MPPNPPTYPARPRKGGPLGIAIEAGNYDSEHHDKWRFEPKVNGWRGLVHTPTGQMWNRHGQPLTIAGEFGEALKKLQELPFTWLDVEGLERRHQIGQGSLIVLDWLVQGVTYDQRREILCQFISEYLIGREVLLDGIHTLPCWPFDHATKLWTKLPKLNTDLGCTFYEGVVAKRGDSEYPFQLRSDSEECDCWVKHRFTTS